MYSLYLLLVAVLVWIIFRLVRRSKKTKFDERILNVKVGSRVGTTPHGDDGGAYDKDEWEGSFWEVVRPTPVSASLYINYVDGSGRTSERAVQVRKFGSYGDSVLLIGHCELRDATRTFRTDRITKCIDQDTGEIVPNVTTYLTKKYEASPEKTKNTLLDEEFDLLRVLLYVGKADGQLRAAEKRVILETCVALTKDSRLTDKDIDQLFAEMDVPSLQAFKLAVGRIAKRDTSHGSIVLGASERMIATQHAAHASETEALEYMRKRFSTRELQKK